MTKSVYIHIPFCEHICAYCDFCKQYYNDDLASKYLEILKKEVEEKYQDEKIETIYIGGGTPSSLSILNLKKLLEIINLFHLNNDYEMTMEVNSENITKEKLLLMKDHGVNRLSIGLESSHGKFLKYLNRHHTYQDVEKSISLMKEIGFKNINVDLIYGLPEENMEDLLMDLDRLMELDITHISTYSLMINKHTILGINKVKEIDEDLDYEMYITICNYLKEKGFEHYEISNFSKEGCESRHNLTYWLNNHYYGFGLGSSGYLDNIRYDNTKSMANYLKGKYLLNKETLDKKEEISYALILGFRLVNGLNKKDFYQRYNVNINDLYNVRDLINKGYLIDNGSNIFVSYDKIYIENQILINFVE